MKFLAGAQVRFIPSFVLIIPAALACSSVSGRADGGPDGSADGSAGGGDGGGVTISEDGGVITAATPSTEIIIDKAKGNFTLKDLVKGVEVRRIHQAADIVMGGNVSTYTTYGKPLQCALNPGREKASVACTGPVSEKLSASFTLTLDASEPGMLRHDSEFSNTGASSVTVGKLHPFRSTTSAGGAFFIGNDPSRVRILQNGSDEHVDFFVNLIPGDSPLTDPELNALVQMYSSYSTGNAVAHDLETGASFLAGFLDFEWAIPLVAMAGDKTRAKTEGARVSMTDLWGEARYARPTDIPPGKTIKGGPAVFITGTPTPHEALEKYADEIARLKQIKLPPEPMSGWDSWYTEGGEESENYIRANADGLAAIFGPFGLSSMQIDSGWQDHWGDWNARDTFPSGMKSTAEYIKARSLKPEIWIAPFSAAEDSEFYKANPGIYPPKNDYGRVLMSKDNHPLDLSTRIAIDRLAELGGRIKDWGYRSVKMDFAYYFLLTVLPPDPDGTVTSLYRNGVRTFRGALDPDTYFINIAMCFPNYGLVDAFRIGLDTWPCWNGTNRDCKDPQARGLSAVGIKAATIMAARRYWMNGRIWWNHNDQIFHRNLTVDEQRAWAAMALVSGGMISFGDNTMGLTAEQADPYRRILPLTGLTARPVDLFTREVPEVWHMRTNEPADADVIALFNWGDNYDFTTNPWTERKDGVPVTHTIDLAALGMDPSAEYAAWEFWTGKPVEQVNGSMTVEVPVHSARIFRLLKNNGLPAYLATDRHASMGPAIVREAVWDADAGKLRGSARTAPGFPQKLFFFVPANFKAEGVSVEGVDETAAAYASGAVYSVSFKGRDSGFHGFEVSITPRP